MLKITRETNDLGIQLRLEGRLVGEWVEELAREIRACEAEGGVSALHVGELSFADCDGLALIRMLRKSCVDFTEPNPFIETLLARCEH